MIGLLKHPGFCLIDVAIVRFRAPGSLPAFAIAPVAF